MADYSPRWYTRSKTVTNPSCNRARRALTSFMPNAANHYATTPTFTHTLRVAPSFIHSYSFISTTVDKTQLWHTAKLNKKLSYRRGTARCVVSVEILPVATQFIHGLIVITRSSAIAEGPRDASCQLKSCQLPRNNAETTCTTSPEEIEVVKLEGTNSTRH